MSAVFSYASPEWDAFRPRILRRDGNACVLARFVGGRCSGILHVHHIEPVAERPDLAFDEDNCVTVCAGHHPALEAFRRLVRRLSARTLPPCKHRHPYPSGRIACDQRRARELGIALDDDLAAAA